MGKPGNLTKKQKHKIVSSMRLAFDGETMRSLARELAECESILRYWYDDLPRDDRKRPGLSKRIEAVESVLRRYREGA